MITDAVGAAAARPGSPQVFQELPVPGSDDRIVLLNPDLGHPQQPFYNLFRTDSHGNTVWRAELPWPERTDRHDGYVEIRWDGPSIAANTWSGWYVLIDPESGKILSKEFVR